MRVRQINLSTVLLILLAAAPVTAEEYVGCIQTEVKPVPHDKAQALGEVTITLMNKCGKDITAYQISFLDSSGNEYAAAGHELLAALVLTDTSGLNVFHRNGTREFSYNPPYPLFKVSVSATIFADRTSKGDAKSLAALISLRRVMLKHFQDQLDLLESFEDWGSTSTLPRKAEEARIADSPSYQYLLNLARQLERSNASSWERVVSRERRRMTSVIELFQLHLQVTTVDGR